MSAHPPSDDERTRSRLAALRSGRPPEPTTPGQPTGPGTGPDEDAPARHLPPPPYALAPSDSPPQEVGSATEASSAGREADPAPREATAPDTGMGPPPGYVPAPAEDPAGPGPLRRLLSRCGLGSAPAPPEQPRPATVALAVLGCLVLAAGVWWLLSGARAGPEPLAPSAANSLPGESAAPSAQAEPSGTTSPAGDVVVHVTGEVAEPGLVTLPAGSRVADAIEAAGGLAEDAASDATDALNLARPLIDGEQVPVGEEALAAAGTGAAGAGDDATPLDLNTATSEDLEELPGVGPVLAEAIVDHRDDQDGFDDVAELQDVRGIGEQRFADLEDRVVVAGAQ